MSGNPNFPPDLHILPSKNAYKEHDCQFDFRSQEDAIRTYGIAGRVWEAAYAMVSYLEHSSDGIFDPPFLQPADFPPHHILELGSGTGIVSSRLAQHIKKAQGTLIVTDLPEVCPLLEQNLASFTQHKSTRIDVIVRSLSWGNKQHALDIYRELRSRYAESFATVPVLTHIICSDLVLDLLSSLHALIAYADPSSLSQVYFPELLAPLLRSLLHLTSPPFTTYPPAFPSVIISYKIRSLAKEAPFWSALGLWFSFEPVLERLRYRDTQTPDLHPRSESRNMPHREQEEEWRRFGSNLDEDMFIFVAHRRPESASWVVPESDEDLLGGVGSRGTQARKTDDTFEGLLLLRLGETDW